MRGEREVAGLRCSEVLAELSAYLDGELVRERRAELEEHVRGCDRCARFGGELGATLARLREALGAATAPPDAVIDHLDRLLEDPEAFASSRSGGDRG